MNRMINVLRESLSLKIFLGIMVALTMVSLLIFGSMSLFVPQTFEKEKSAQFITNFNKLASQLETIPIAELESHVTAFAAENLASVSVLDKDNNSISEVSYMTYSGDSVNNNNMVTGTLEFQNSGEIYTINAMITASSANQLSGIFIKIFPAMLCIILIVSIVVALLYSRILAKPIVNISVISKKMATLDLTWRCDIRRTDEIGDLANNLNQMATSLNSTLLELQSANEKLQEDIAWERQQEKQRQDFFAAVSHELKTPVAVLKGELEGMIYNVGKYKDRDAYLQEAFETTELIESSVKEIMSLVKMHVEDVKPHKEKINLHNLVKDACKVYGEMIKQKEIVLQYDMDDSITYYGDYINLKKALSNIIGNAVNHSPPNANIHISLTLDINKAVLIIENSNTHIHDVEMKRLFEPFYRIDKSRSRYTGGSGLGLYITKNILDMHKLQYTLSNTENGVAFSILFDII